MIGACTRTSLNSLVNMKDTHFSELNLIHLQEKPFFPTNSTVLPAAIRNLFIHRYTNHDDK